MAIDGSFSVEVALGRFLARCPELANHPQIHALARKGARLTDHDVVNGVAAIFLHQKYTIPLVGCFRPLAWRIADQVVFLLRPINLRANTNGASDGNVNNLAESETNVIEQCVRNGMGLVLHELACLAFCRALDLAPFLMGSILDYFKFAPPPFERIKDFDLSVKVDGHLLDVIRISYRFLVISPGVFSKLWDWSCFLDLANQLRVFSGNTEQRDNDADIRWCTAQVLSITFNLGDASRALSIEADEPCACLARWEEFVRDVSLEKAVLYIEISEEMRSDAKIDIDRLLDYLAGNPMALSLYADSKVSKSPKLEQWDEWSSSPPFVITSLVRRSFEMVLLAVSQKWPVLLYGPPGVGKSALIRELARRSGNYVLYIHMDDQIDGKTLLGSYVCTENPGEFRWQAGSLTQAVLKGFWVVFEDIDKAPSDVHSILLPLLEGARCFLTGHGEKVEVAERFRLFATISGTQHNKSSGSSWPGTLWRKVMVRQASPEDLKDILKVRFPGLEPLSEKLIETFKKVSDRVEQKVTGWNSTSGRFSLRDLLRWCKRIEGSGICIEGGSLSVHECQRIYEEAVDVFAAFLSSESGRAIRKEIARIWAVPISVAETLNPGHKPLIQDLAFGKRIGRVILQHSGTALHKKRKPFVEIQNSLHALERIACSIKYNEPVLLVGETGTGKTTLVQSLASMVDQKLTVLNLSQQSDVADLLGGFKPISPRDVCTALYNEFDELFRTTVSRKTNAKFLDCLGKHLRRKNWKVLLDGMLKGVKTFQDNINIRAKSPSKKRKKQVNEEAWDTLSLKLEIASRQVGASSGMMFSFVEGAFVTALRNGEWILLDELNLAPDETLQRIGGVLEEEGSLCLAERGDVHFVKRHPNFRIFGCMNPATDAGKRDLPHSIRSRFTELFIDDFLDDDDLSLFVSEFLDENHLNEDIVRRIVRFYRAARKDSEEILQDGANQKPQYSLRSLFRALDYTRKAKHLCSFEEALYDGFCMFFVTLLDSPSAKIMKGRISSYLLGGRVPHRPLDYYVTPKTNSSPDDIVEKYVLTRTVREQLRNLYRAAIIQKCPVLLQGPTSSGKTSLVRYLAAVTGRKFVRINNHEHTDLQEYLGSYVTDSSGKLVFHEGELVRAVRNGFWIVLDELNLAPSDVLEALNRLLDDNRELLVPELRETIQAHPDFMLFATQNPPTVYAGRKMLSRAFRNRFVEIHVDEIPEDELTTILKERCLIPQSYADEMVKVMKDLQLHRQSSNVFAGKHGYITPRDLFRWANRVKESENSRGNSISTRHRHEDLAKEGYYLLAERLRDESERGVVKGVLERHFHLSIDEDDLYKQELSQVETANNVDNNFSSCRNVIWTKSMWRMYSLVKRCYDLHEPVLLVGETGGGKTTVCQWLSVVLGTKLHILNCHQHTETSDFLGGFYPIRERSRLILRFKDLVKQLMVSSAFINYPNAPVVSFDIGNASSTLDQLGTIVNDYRSGVISPYGVDLDAFEQMKMELEQLHGEWQTIFSWQDGPLVLAMKHGHLFLVDEISLSDDSVLERLNSVLEPERTLSLPEKGGSEMEKVTAENGFLVLATMNPGGDYGKKELSPALRNRFTEIWVPAVTDLNDIRIIASQKISRPEFLCVVDPMTNFFEWFNKLDVGRTLTVRDLLSWISFVNVTGESLGVEYALLHGVFLVLLDGLGLGTGIQRSEAEELRERCLQFLLEHLQVDRNSPKYSILSNMEKYGWGSPDSAEVISLSDDMECDNVFGIDPFYVERGRVTCEAEVFELSAPTTRRNALRVLRAMQLRKPVLLEGSPGVGKTSLVVALGRFSGHKVVRINLSEQTDMMDLLGSDLPVESDDEGIKFSWSDGILLQALKEGCWVLLDELNLAPQSVLEGLNAILDHRAEVYIPELNQTFSCPPTFRVFACQNPSSQGGGRKGLPKSFLNRFTKVYVDELVKEDLLSICKSLFPSIPISRLEKLISFNKQLFEETMIHRNFAHDGSPWEFNLRDVIRSCEIIKDAPEESRFDWLNLLYIQRMRTASDRKEVLRLFERIFEVKPFINPFPRVQINHHYLIVGTTAIKRNSSNMPEVSNTELKMLPSTRLNLEAAANCVKRQWLCILVGQSSSGKNSLIRMLAQLTGNVLHELNLSSATDISELLGSFEQYSVFRDIESVASKIEIFIREYSRVQLQHSEEGSIIGARSLLSRWHSFLSRLDFEESSGSTFMQQEVLDLMEIVELLKQETQRNTSPISWSSEELDTIEGRILKLKKVVERRTFSAKFEWVTGVLVKAVENGEWVVLKNANLCNPTVLDRINSLVETSGSITINECGKVDGKPVILHPHPNFRMFLTVNPIYGEISRAMRNRGVEICMMPPFWLLEGRGESILTEMELKDMKRFLIQSGIPNPSLVDSMARAHIYARDKGLCLNVRITYFELACWVELFQQLLVKGNQPLWSLRVSWEHTYLSSLGELEGESIVSHAIDEYLMIKAFQCSDSSSEPLCLPGGWPLPLQVRDFVWKPTGASIKQNCMYLEYLVAKSATCRVAGSTATCRVDGSNASMDQDLNASSGSHAYVMDIRMLRRIMFPNYSSNTIPGRHGKDKVIDLALVDRMIWFATEWVIEQATESDLSLYRCWVSWFSSQLKPYSQILSTFVSTLERELSHPIWKYIFHYCSQLKSVSQTDTDLQCVPLLSSQLVDLVRSSSSGASDLSSSHLQNALNCIGLLRRTYQQWYAEERSSEFHNFELLMRPLRLLEEEVLKMLPKSPFFDILVQLCNRLVEDHAQFWDCIMSHNIDRQRFFWRCLRKDAEKLQDFCPQAAATIDELKENKNLYLEKSLLWIHGGHPILPPSGDVYYAQLKFLKLCDSIWAMETNFSNYTDLLASFDSELRFLAVQGICIASHLSAEDSAHIVEELEKMYQMLLKRFQDEKHRVETSLGSNEISCFKAVPEACCIVSPQLFLTKTGCDSWLGLFNINGCTSFFQDMKIIQEISSVILLNPEELQHACDLLDSALHFSLKYSLRPPQVFSGHQKLLWTVDAWNSIDSVNMKVAAFVLEMWFGWHSTMWSLTIGSSTELQRHNGLDLIPDILMRPFRVLTMAQNLEPSISIRGYSTFFLKLKVASSNLWQSSSLETKVPSFLLSTARANLQQILYAHRKSFTAENFRAIKSMFVAFQGSSIEQDDIHKLSSLIRLSSHQGLREAVQSFVEPVLRHLYIHSTEFSDYNMGLTWLRIGGMRYHLLLGTDDLDPAMKYYCKQTLLAQKKSMLELEIKVREECDYLAGWSSSRGPDDRRLQTLNHLENESRRIQRKVVFRSNPMKFKKLRGELTEFRYHITSVMSLVSREKLQDADKQVIIQQLLDWQKTSMSFIHRLSEEYHEYVDIVQPMQVAIYEMKLGLSLVQSSIFEGNFLNKIHEESIDRVMATICSFMRFPRPTLPARPKIAVLQSSNNLDDMDELYLYKKELLEKLVSVTMVPQADESKQESLLQLKASVHYNMLVQAAHSIYNEQLMRGTSFKFLEIIFDEFAKLWMDMKFQAKEKEELASQLYKFRTRRVKIETVVEVDISSLGESFKNESFVEWQESAAEEENDEVINPAGDSENLEEAWSLMQEPILNDMVKIYIQLFGSSNLVILPGTSQISDEEILRSFGESYRLGIRIIKDLSSLKSAILDATLVPEHLLQLCLDHEQRCISSRHPYKFYKDPNAPIMGNMVPFLTALEKRVNFLLNENEDHPGLQKVSDIVKMMLAIPLNTPLAKALSGLQFLLSRGFMVKESSPKLSLAEQLDPIVDLVVSWQKMELEAMPLLLDELEEQYEINAAKLWFPLYSVLCTQSADVSACSESTIQSLQEFIHMSNVGEFRMRLQLILAFHVQISTRIQLEINLRPCDKENLKILYNLFGFCMQFLPIVMEHMENSRRSTEKEIRELQKLCKWERLMSMEDSKRMRQKLRKLIKKYSDALEQPVKLVLNRRAAQSGIDTQFLQASQLLYVFPDENVHALAETSGSNRFLWYDNWVKKLSDLHSLVTPESYNPLFFFMPAEEADSIVRKCLSKQTVGLYQEKWKDIVFTLEVVAQMACENGELWKSESKTVIKRRALSELLKRLENCGLARHMPSLTEDSNWLRQSSHNPAHLLLKKFETADVSSCDENDGLSKEADLHWKTINGYHFKSIIAIQLLQHVSMRFHKDFTLEQVTRSVSFLHHLADVQLEQRDALYSLVDNLRCLQKWISSLHSAIDSSSEFITSQNQDTVLECLWQQKQLFDGLWSTMREGVLLLKKVEIIHLDTCESVRPGAQEISAMLERFIPVVQKSKETLDKTLLNHDGAITVLDQSLDVTVVSMLMEELVLHNFEVLKDLEKGIISSQRQSSDRSSVSQRLMDHLDEIFQKKKLVLEQFKCKSGGSRESNNLRGSDSNSEQESVEAFRVAYKHVLDVLQRLASSSDKKVTGNDSRGHVPSWKDVFYSYAAELRMGQLCDGIRKAVRSAEKLIASSSSEAAPPSFPVGSYLKTLSSTLSLLFDFGNNLLKDLLALHRMMCITTHALAKNLALLYSRGYGNSAEEQVEDNAPGMSQTAEGTGMGEGTGVNDVSDQITDEDQLLGDSSKTGEEKDASGDIPNKKDKGIEMEQDFDADMYSVSKDSDNDDDDNEESDGEQIESVMGKVGDDGEVVDEKQWDENEDKDDNDASEHRNEKYETGPSVEKGDKSSLELRGKEGEEAESDEHQDDVNEAEPNESGGDQENVGDAENMEDMKLDKEDAYMDPSGVEPNELNQSPEEELDHREEEVEGTDAMEEGSPQEEDIMEEDLEQAGEDDDETGTKPVTDVSEQSMEGQDSDPNKQEEDLTFPKKDLMKSGTSSHSDDYVPNSEVGIALKNDSGASGAVNGRQEMDWSNQENPVNDLAPFSGLPSGAHSEQQDILVAGQSDLGKLTEDRPKSQASRDETSTLQRSQPNPYRNVGDALEGWKERARVPVHLDLGKMEAEGDEIEDGNAEEYGFVSEHEKGTAQALGSANSEQIDNQVTSSKDGEEDPATARADDPVDIDIQMQTLETKPKIQSASVEKQKKEEPVVIPPEEASLEATDHHDGRNQKHLESIVRVKKHSSSDDILHLSTMKLSNDEELKGLNDQILQISGGENADGASMWRRYEIRTTRLSQELTEQLRLVMEPTLASKLQGDYKTGKRINMKKVIPYIASHYRKDKIWLRRTRPNKRDYQVVVAIDDSKSMSQNGCAEVAVEALVTICRALSQIELGSLAVASFGKMGNVRLLHDFDRPFSAEAGIKMISNLTFKQDNSVLASPMLDLLKHLNSMLDVNISKARLPSGQNPLQQLVLIISDGDINERESLKRRVRDFLSSKRMVTFLILDSSSEGSIMDRVEASVQKDGSMKISRYMDSFPFPYYAMLRNVEALPRSLADLLRQWFEIMQNSRD